MSDKFVVTIPVKPYVKRFIELNYGLPADFSKHPDIQKEVLRCLKKPRTRFDVQFDRQQLCTYTQTMEIVISQDYFYRYGWEFSKTDTVTFGKIFESMVKCKMHNVVSIYRGVGLTIKESIQKFQEHTKMEEEYWPYESIKKEYYRRRPENEIDFFVEIIGKIDTIFMEILSRKKDNITRQKTQHETAEQTI